jgi:hypothetical protein
MQAGLPGPRGPWAAVYRAAVGHLLRVGMRPAAVRPMPVDPVEGASGVAHVRVPRRPLAGALGPAAFLPAPPLPSHWAAALPSREWRMWGQTHVPPRDDGLVDVRRRRPRGALEALWGPPGSPRLPLRQCHRLTFAQTRSQPVVFLFDALFEASKRPSARQARKRAMRQAYGLFREQVGLPDLPTCTAAVDVECASGVKRRLLMERGLRLLAKCVHACVCVKSVRVYVCVCVCVKNVCVIFV